MAATTPDINHFVKVKVSEDKMQASLIVENIDDAAPDVFSEQGVIRVIHDSGVKYGLKKERVQELLENKENTEVLIAEGLEPTKGENAQLEYCFPTENSLKPKILEDGRVDYKEVNLIHSIEKDAILVKKVSAQPGKLGYNVFGEELPTINGDDVSAMPGLNTYIDEKDELIIRASCDGVIKYEPRDHMVEVEPICKIKGSVDFTTGNLHVNSLVEVTVDVKPGFEITTPYDVEVKGMVEHANIECDGKLNVRLGITGDGQNKIKVGGDIQAVYIHHQNIICGGSLHVANEIRDTNVSVKNEILLSSSKGLIVGGTLTAVNRVRAATIGCLTSVPTKIEVGLNPEYKDAYLSKKEKLDEIEEKINKIREAVTKIIKTSAQGTKDYRLNRFKLDWQKLTKVQEPLEKEVQDLKNLLYCAEKPEVIVLDCIYPACEIKIEAATFRVTDEMRQVKFQLEEGKIGYASLTSDDLKS